ncbi:hypothetical protein [Desulfobacula sp.]|uniref:hypothetical protein n=1 Tax=Desulfobacula sp. TaxID=2593537 RepID=UPI00263546BC|nr:hypothetical protein [Desulfobacula sp.]
MPKKVQHSIRVMVNLIPALAVAGLILLPIDGYATQLHASSEGIITHQIGHLFFLFSMVVLIFTIIGKGLDKQKGWRLIQYSAFFFVLWNLDVITAHFFDNQIYAVRIENISLSRISVMSQNDSAVLAWLYYGLKLDHLLCVPAMLLLYKGLSNLVKEQRQMMLNKDKP